MIKLLINIQNVLLKVHPLTKHCAHLLSTQIFTTYYLKQRTKITALKLQCVLAGLGQLITSVATNLINIPT